MPCRLARLPIDPCVNRCSELPLRLTVELGREENRSVLQDGVGATKILILTFELLHSSSFVSGETRSLAVVDLGPSNPGPERLRRHAEQFRDVTDARPLGLVVRSLVEHHPHCSFTQLG